MFSKIYCFYIQFINNFEKSIEIILKYLKTLILKGLLMLNDFICHHCFLISHHSYQNKLSLWLKHMKHMLKLCVCSCCFCQLGERMRNFIRHIHVFQILSFHTHTVKLRRSLEWLCEEFFPNVMRFISERYRPRAQDFRLSSRNSLLCTFFPPFFWPQSMWDPSSPTRDWAHALCIGRLEPLGHQGSPSALYSIKILSVHQNLYWELNLGN